MKIETSIKRERVIGSIEVLCDNEIMIVLSFDLYAYTTWFFL